ncbi:MAG: carboxypeptidase-like regulatory domain-containing protein [Saprospiraceae bacterium]|nr:carboxypeptidase-like regulatory domain-containing protein [Saprospiraceae bacterium]
MTVRLQIPKPCNQSWSDMQALDATRRHCDSCQRIITDFSHYTDAQLLAYLAAHDQRICGRFRPDQLDRPLHPATAPPRNGVFGALAAGFAAFLATQQPPLPPGQHNETIEQVATSSIPATSNSPRQDSLRMISGRITDRETGEPLPGATVNLRGTTLGACTNIEGVFNLTVPLNTLHQQTPVLNISYTGYHSTEIPLPERVRHEDLALISTSLQLEQDTTIMLLGEITMPRPSLLQRLRHTFLPRRHR